MLSPVWYLLSVGAVLQASAPAQNSWIADVKVKRATLGATEVQLEGDVVDLRSTSPTSRSGYYRLIDASDPEGVLVRTGKLPMDGGALRIRARRAPQQPPGGLLLLDELDQIRLDRRPIAPVVLSVVSLLSFVVLAVLLVRAAIEERRYKLTPPLWLLPEAGPYGKALAAGQATQSLPLKYAPELEEADRLHRDQLQKRKRNLFQALIGSFGLTGGSAAWLLVTQPVSAQVPAFIFIEANDTPIPIVRHVEPSPDGNLVQATLDSLLLAMRAAPLPRDSGRRRPAPGGNPEQNTALPFGVSTSPAPGSESLPPVALGPAPAPVPAPAPPPEVEAAPTRDPEAERTLASESLSRAASRLVEAINGRRLTEVALLMPEALAGDLSRRERFMKLLKDYSPRAALGAVEGTALAEERGEAKFTVQLAWRGDFGVQARKSGRFLGLLRRDAGGWRFEGARLLDPLP